MFEEIKFVIEGSTASMIYSPDIEKKCALCQKARIISEGNEEKIFCEYKGKMLDISSDACKKFDYDIFKRKVRRRKEFSADVSAQDFEL